MKPYADRGQLSGIVTLVMHKGEILHQAAVGFQTVEDRKPMATDSIFQVMSMTKPVTGVAVKSGNAPIALSKSAKIEVVDTAGIAAPEFKIEILRNDDGISLIGLAPAAMDRDAFLTGIDSLAAGDLVTDMLETADYEVPPDWQATVDFALEALTRRSR